MSQKFETVVDGRGRMVIPRDLRNKIRLKAATRITIVYDGSRLSLKIPESDPRTALDRLFKKIDGRKLPKVSAKEIKREIGECRKTKRKKRQA